jgi:signal peptidase I
VSAIRIARLSIAVALLLAGVWMFLPTSLGGSATYVSTFGTSMEPGFHTGDLAVLRPAGSYEVGDVIAYRSDSLNTTVMHRIVDRDGDRFVTQGDNNSWLDEDHPALDHVKGSLWFQIPHGGKALAALRSPALVLPVTVAIGALMWVLRRPRRAARVRRGPAARGGRMLPAPRLTPSDRALARQVLIGSSVLAVLSLTAASALLVLPDDQTETRAVPVTQSGQYTYSGEAFPGTTYPDGHVDTGDPIYTALAGPLTVSYEQSLASGGNLETEGTVGLGLSLSAPDGWTTEMDGGSPVPMQDSTATATVALDTVGAAALLAAHYAEVGVDGGAATLTVTPQVDVDGTVDGRPFALPAAPQLAFTLDPAALKLVGGPEALQTSAGTTVSLDEIVPRTFTLGAVTLSIRDARVLALGVGVLALVLMVVASWLGGARSTSPVDAFLQRRAARVLAVAGFAPDGTVVDVADPEALYKVATRLDALLLHHAGPDGDTFAVRDIGTTYRCVVPRVAVPEPKPRPVRAGRTLRRFA